MRKVESLLIGNFQIVQDTAYYRFTSDAVLLARFLKAKRGETVADFCAGSGIVGLHFYAENPAVRRVVLFEADEALAKMSEETIAFNGIQDVFRVEHVRVQDIGNEFCEQFSLILSNPPYERAGSGAVNRDPAKAPCRSELSLSLFELCAAAAKCLRYGGRFALIHRADRVAEVLVSLRENALEPKKLQFVAGKEGKKPYAVLVMAAKGGKAGVDVLPTLFNVR